ncbi:MAG: lipopolysaccharide biosynthesis protein [Planctomycetes bacterium]|nr:lipopolysaccharide biosynthesis protein [Planctomycetota bacterium]
MSEPEPGPEPGPEPEPGPANEDTPEPPPADPRYAEWLSSEAEDLESRALRGGGLNLAVQGVRLVVELGSLPILARLLLPADFGAIAQATAVTGFLVLFKDLGLSVATVQRKHVTHGQISALFWLNLALGLLVAALVAGSAPALVWLYGGDIRPGQVALALAGVVLFDAAAAQHLALLRRRLRFGWLATIQFVGVIGGIVAALGVAYAGWGFWALVLRAAVTSVLTLLLAWVACSWRPGRFSRDQVSGDMIRFGGYVTGIEIVAHLSKNVDNILIGRTYGPAALGLYTKAYSLLTLPLNAINGPLAAVAMPALSRVQDEAEAYRGLFLRGCRLALLAQIPLVAIAGLCTEDLVSVGLGDQWTGAVELFRALIPAALAITTAPATTWVFVSSGHPDRSLRASVTALPFVILGFVIGLQYGPVGVAWGYSVAICVVRVPTILYAFQPTSLRLRDLGAVLLRPMMSAALAVGAVVGVRQPALAPPGLGRLLLELTTFGLAYGACVAWLPGGRAYRGELGAAWALMRRHG